MSDRYQQLINTPLGKLVSKQVGLPAPVRLQRFSPGQPVLDGPVLLGAATGGRLSPAIARVLAAVGAEVHTPMTDEVRSAAADAELDAKVFNPEVAPSDQTFNALVFDATGIVSTDQLRAAFEFFASTIRRVRAVRAGDRARHAAGGVREPSGGGRAASARGTRALDRQGGPQGRHGAADVCHARGRGAIESTLRFFLSPKSAYVSGQVVRIVAAGRSARGDRLGLAAERQGRARDRRRPRDRRGDRRGARARRRPRRRPRRAGAGR